METGDDSGGFPRPAERRNGGAWAQFYDRHGRLVYAVVLRIVGNRQAAEDLVQAIFLRAWSRAQDFGGSHSAVGPWLIAVARNRALGYVLSQQGKAHRQAFFEEIEEPRLYAGLEGGTSFAQRAQRVKDALALLPDDQRQAIELACFNGLSPSAIAIELGQPAETVQPWLRSALARMAEDAGGRGGQMGCAELRGHYELYALGLAEQPARDAIHAHLQQRCAACASGVPQALGLVAALCALAPAASPPAGLRRRVLAAAGIPEVHYGWPVFWAAATLLCLSAAVYFSGRERQYAEESLQLRRQLGDRAAEIRRLQQAGDILSAPDTTEAAFDEGQPTRPAGRVYVNPTGGVLLIASHLPPAPAGRIYEMWIIPKGGAPQVAGLFQSRNDQTTIHTEPGPVDMASLAAVAVTLESEAGAAQPAAKPTIVVTFAAPAR